jgi:lysophospholipase L1-like esterase
LYANALAARYGGIRPGVVNLGVDAETSSTFFNGGPQGNGQLSGYPAPQLNLNYPNPAPTQNALMQTTIGNELAAGHSIGSVSVQLGANDLFTVLNQPGFFALGAADQQAAVALALGTLQSNLTTLLLELKTELPHAEILMMGYYNPYNADPTSALDHIIDPAVQALNMLLAGEAKAFGARFVNTYTPFLGHELADTYIAQGNVHPNSEGYALIARAMAPVPEPSTMFLMGISLVITIAASRRRRASRSRSGFVPG